VTRHDRCPSEHFCSLKFDKRLGGDPMRDCATCGVPFEARRSDARFCSAACRAASHRGDIAAVIPLGVGGSVSVVDGLADSVRARIEAAGLVEEPHAVATLKLAQMMEQTSGAAYAAMHRQLLSSLEKLDALAPVVDRVDDLRLRRDRKRSRTA
jgi:hypothetical protein